jgi:8-oxo-dGTP pyrophosphatase MutT (NUDIX family)
VIGAAAAIPIIADVEPEYACALIIDARGWLLLQLRPSTARHAPSQMTCFGGRRELNETALTCVRREIYEELAWPIDECVPVGELWKGSRFIARFFRACYQAAPLRTEPGHGAVWVPWAALRGLPVSPWHMAMLEALHAGRQRTDLDHELVAVEKP